MVIVDDNGVQVYPKAQYTTIKKSTKSKRDKELENIINGSNITLNDIEEFCSKKYNQNDINKLTTEQYIEMITRIETKKNDAESNRKNTR